MGTQVVGTPDLYHTDNRKKALVAPFFETRRVTARTGHFNLIGIRQFELQQLRQGCGSGLMHSGPHGCLDALQIEPPCRLAVAENDPQQFFYFAGDFFLDRFDRFFSSADDAVCSTGRKRQIFRLTPTRSSVKCWNLRYSAISPSAFWMAAGDGRLCVTVLPSTF